MTSSSAKPDPRSVTDNPPWYRLPIVWMVIGGPAVVVVAALITVYIAVVNIDPVIDTSAEPTQGQSPAGKARNHANELKSTLSDER